MAQPRSELREVLLKLWKRETRDGRGAESRQLGREAGWQGRAAIAGQVKGSSS